jgi:hypothetical protein
VRTILIYCGAAAVLVGAVPSTVWAGSSGRRNTAIAATAGAAIAWSRYQDAKESERCRPVKTVVITERRPVVQRRVVYETRPVVQREVVYVHCDDRDGRKHKHHRCKWSSGEHHRSHKRHKHQKCGECEHRGHHKPHDRDDCDDD